MTIRAKDAAAGKLKILILREDAIGDMVLAMPVVSALHDRFPSAEITVLVSNYSGNGELIAHLPYVHELMLSPQIQSFRDVLAFAKVLRSKKFTHSVHLSTRAGTSWACFLGVSKNSGDKAVLGLLPVFFRWGRFCPPHDMMVHQVQRNFGLLRPFGLSERDAASWPLRLTPHPDDAAAVREKLQTRGFDFGKKTLCIHLGAAGGNKPVLPDKYAAYAMSLHRDSPDIQIMITGASDEEKSFRDQFLAKIDFPVIDMVGATRLREVLTLLTYCHVFVGIDTGPAHMAAGLGVPQLLLSTSKRVLPFKWGPWLNRHRIVRENSRCAISCHARACAEWTCVDDLSVADMVRHTVALFAGDGYATFDDQQLYWFQTAMPMLVLVDDVSRTRGQFLVETWRSWGLTVHLAEAADPALYDKCVAWDVRIIQNLSSRKKVRLFVMAQMLNKDLSHPPLLCHGDPACETVLSLLAHYRGLFSRRIL
jgi:ADP-heptose:LPS heptosyltransferase